MPSPIRSLRTVLLSSLVLIVGLPGCGSGGADGADAQGQGGSAGKTSSHHAGSSGSKAGSKQSTGDDDDDSGGHAGSVTIGSGGSSSAGGSGAGTDCQRTDGKVDQAGCPCTPGQTQKCYAGPADSAGVGLCAFGSQTCLAGTQSGDTGASDLWGPCQGSVLPAETETCDGKDHDCDGSTTDGCATCEPGEVDKCQVNGQDGQRTCQTDKTWGDCTPTTECESGAVDGPGCDASCPNGGGERLCHDGSFGPCTCKCQPQSCSTLCGPGMRTCDASGNLGACQAPATTTACTCASGQTGTATCTDGKQSDCVCQAPTASPTCNSCVDQQCSWQAVANASESLGNDTSGCKAYYDKFRDCLNQNKGNGYMCDQVIGGCDDNCGCGNIIRLASDCVMTGEGYDAGQIGKQGGCSQECTSQ